MDLKRYFLINESDLSRSVVNTALAKINRQSVADTPRLTTVDVNGDYYATTMSIGQMNQFHEYISSLNVPFRMLTEPPKLAKAKPAEDVTTTTRQATPDEVEAVEEFFESVGDMFDKLGKLFGGPNKPK